MIKSNGSHKVRINCPYCSRQYNIDEIFVLNNLGDPNYNVESYICDDCGKEFKVKIDIRFFISKAKIGLFVEDETVIPWNKKS